MQKSIFFHKHREIVKYYKNLHKKKIIDAVNKLSTGQMNYGAWSMEGGGCDCKKRTQKSRNKI